MNGSRIGLWVWGWRTASLERRKSGIIYINVEISASSGEKDSEPGPEIFGRACDGELSAGLCAARVGVQTDSAISTEVLRVCGGRRRDAPGITACEQGGHWPHLKTSDSGCRRK